MQPNQRTLNPHYDFGAEENRALIDAMQEYAQAWHSGNTDIIQQAERLTLKGVETYQVGVTVESPWGENEVLDAHIDQFGKNQDTVKKKITVKPGFMLSLQRHRGREESWRVVEGELTVISNGQLHTVNKDEEITLPIDNVHCMINRSDVPLMITETQKGTCRESDSVRLIDFNNRPTVPLTTKVEAESAILYSEIHSEIKQKFGCKYDPKSSLMSDKYRDYISKLA
ncbi:MAG: phosphomannose isomerase type II C-terminal cupin domain [Alphaproteobacteria bacterium]|nr:phosphomannose isomerase type II C-terminal cupin domain [Alphaproteobacteria bacterium]